MPRLAIAERGSFLPINSFRNGRGWTSVWDAIEGQWLSKTSRSHPGSFPGCRSGLHRSGLEEHQGAD
jgi:hypothetical protein